MSYISQFDRFLRPSVNLPRRPSHSPRTSLTSTSKQGGSPGALPPPTSLPKPSPSGCSHVLEGALGGGGSGDHAAQTLAAFSSFPREGCTAGHASPTPSPEGGSETSGSPPPTPEIEPTKSQGWFLDCMLGPHCLARLILTTSERRWWEQWWLPWWHANPARDNHHRTPTWWDTPWWQVRARMAVAAPRRRLVSPGPLAPRRTLFVLSPLLSPSLPLALAPPHHHTHTHTHWQAPFAVAPCAHAHLWLWL
jgi:hypothetical protein